MQQHFTCVVGVTTQVFSMVKSLVEYWDESKNTCVTIITQDPIQLVVQDSHSGKHKLHVHTSYCLAILYSFVQ